MSTKHEVHLDKFECHGSNFIFAAGPGDTNWTRYSVTDSIGVLIGDNTNPPRPFLWYINPQLEDIVNNSGTGSTFNILSRYYTLMKLCKVVIELDPILEQDNFTVVSNDTSTFQKPLRRDYFGYCVDPIYRQLLLNEEGSYTGVPSGWDDLISNRTNGHKHSMNKICHITINPMVSVPLVSNQNFDQINNTVLSTGSTVINGGVPTDFGYVKSVKFPWIPTTRGTEIKDASPNTGQAYGQQVVQANARNTPAVHGVYIGFPRNQRTASYFRYKVTFYVAFKNRRGHYQYQILS